MSDFGFELPPSPEFDASQRERHSILASYVLGAIINASSEGFKDDTLIAISYIQTHTHFDDGRLITDDDVNAIAASSVLVQMVESCIKEQPIVLVPEVAKALPVYHKAQAVVDEVGLTLIVAQLALPTVLSTAKRLIGKDVSTTPNIEAAVATFNKRGSVLMEIESLDDMQAAIAAKDFSSEAPDIYFEEKNGTRVEGYNLANLEVPSRTEKLPYYAQYYEVEHGGEWLGSLLEDIKEIHAHMS